MRLLKIMILIICIFISMEATGVKKIQGMEFNTDRPGLDYRSFDLPWDDPGLCQEACTRDSKCKAWTYVKPNIQGPYARCWLKHSVPNPRSGTCCISGTRGDSIIGEQTATNPRDCKSFRDNYFKKCDEIGAYYSRLNCERHGYSGCALDVVSCFTPFLPSHIFTDQACGRPGYIDCVTKVYDRYLECLRYCNKTSIDGTLTEGLGKCGQNCKLRIESDLHGCP